MTNMYRESPVSNLQSWAIDYDKVHLRSKYYFSLKGLRHNWTLLLLIIQGDVTVTD